MTNENLKQIMGKEWQKVRKNFNYPQLPHPRLTDNILNGEINMENLEIKVSEPFIWELKEKSISPDESFNEVLSHELVHFLKYPGSVLNSLRLQKSVQGIVEGDKINELRKAFTEAQTNIYQLNELKHPSTAKVRKAHGLEEGDDFGRLMYGLYQEVSGQDLGIESKEKNLIKKLKGTLKKSSINKEKDLIKKLKVIDYTNKRNETTNFRKFVEILKDYVSKKEQDQKGQGNQSGDKGFGRFSKNQIREGLKQFVKECSNPGEYEAIVKQILGEGKFGEEKNDSQPIRRKGIGVDKGITFLASNFYTALAEKYAIPIRKKSMHKNGGLYPHSHDPFTLGDPITEVDAFSTPGIFPGITKKWKRKEGEVYGDDEAVPDSFLIIDNSPSMPNPEEGISIPVLGATAISNAYLTNDSRVAIYSFGNNDYLTNPTKDREIVHIELRRYSDTGGTTFNSSFLENVLKGSEKEYDISVVSDMCISNFGNFVDTVLKLPKTHRVHLLYTNNGEDEMTYVNSLKESFGDKENVAILPLIHEKDIKKITMGELKKSVK